MRAIGFVAAVVLITGMGCSKSGDSSSGDGRGGDASHHGTTPGTGSGGSGAGTAGAFGNPDGNQTNIPGGMNAGTGGANGAGSGGAPSQCQVGKFCAPTAPDPRDCGTITLESSVKTISNPGNVLLIFDRSFSMADDWNGAPRWQGAGNAVLASLMPLQDLLTIGGVMYPSVTPSEGGFLACGVDAFTSTEQLAFQPGAMALTALMAAAPSGSPSPMYAPVGSNLGSNMNEPVGATPTMEAFQAANVALQNSTLTGTTVAILITDGEPNCMWDQNTTTTIVSTWLSTLNVKTYVIGLPGVAGMGMGGQMSNGPAVLNAIAQAGGTMQYIDAADTTTLQMQLTAIVMSTVSAGFDSCSIDLDPAADPADKLQLVLTEPIMGVATDEAAPHDLGGGAGWTISDDGKHVELVGSLCADAMTGRFNSLKFTYGCKELPPLMKDPPPE
jgi:hypothetical protein